MDYRSLFVALKVVPRKGLDRRLFLLAEEIDEDWLLRRELPDGAFYFLAKLFVHPLTAGRRGLFHIVRLIYLEFHRFSEAQRQLLLAIWLAHRRKLQDPLARFAVADLIARQYPAERVLEEFSAIATRDDPVSRHFAFDGLDVLRIRHDVDPKVRLAAAVRQAAIPDPS